MSMKESHKLCHYNQVLLIVRCIVQVKEKYFKTKYKPPGILLKFLRYLFVILHISLKVCGNFMHKVNYCYSCHFTGLEFIQLPERQWICILKDEKMIDSLT
jgi:hypothetical protein